MSSNPVSLDAIQWSDLRHIADVEPVGERDAACLEEVRAVLEKHGALKRFGLTLLHSHFDLADDEIMLETTDVETREQLIRPVKLSSIDPEVRIQTTVVCFDEKGYHRRCGCDPRASGHHHK